VELKVSYIPVTEGWVKQLRCVRGLET
jgi:hypothetical protein